MSSHSSLWPAGKLSTLSHGLPKDICIELPHPGQRSAEAGYIEKLFLKNLRKISYKSNVFAANKREQGRVTGVVIFESSCCPQLCNICLIVDVNKTNKCSWPLMMRLTNILDFWIQQRICSQIRITCCLINHVVLFT